jgi:hypothetical protein
MNPNFATRIAATLLVVAAALLAGAGQARAQAQKDTTVELERLKTPTSPAFVILDISPTDVERPTTPRAFALGLVSAAQESDDFVPDNYAAEFAPYWLGPQRKLTFEQYYSRSMLRAVQQTFSLSFATNTVVQNEDSLPAVAVGFRVAPFVGRASRRLDSLVEHLDHIQDSLLNVRIALRGARTANDTADALKKEQAFSDSNRVLTAGIRAEMNDDDGRVGFRMQIAGGLAAYYPGNQFSAGKIGRTGLWGTAAYRLEHPGVDLIALARFLSNDEGTEQEALDLGARAVLLFEPFAASFEWVSRSVSGDEGDGPDGRPGFASGSRGVGMLEYRVNNDLFLSFSFGQDYRRAGEDEQPLVAILGGQLNLGSKPLIELPK